MCGINSFDWLKLNEIVYGRSDRGEIISSEATKSTRKSSQAEMIALPLEEKIPGLIWCTLYFIVGLIRLNDLSESNHSRSFFSEICLFILNYLRRSVESSVSRGDLHFDCVSRAMVSGGDLDMVPSS